MAQPVWITPAGSIGVIPEGVFYQQNMLASTTPLAAHPICTATTAGTNIITCDSTAGMWPGLNVMFSGTTFGGISEFIRYFVLEVVSATEFKISATEFDEDAIQLTDGTGYLVATLTQHVYFTLQSGTLPLGIQMSDNGLIIGVPLAVASLQGVPAEVARDVTSKFTVRGYTQNYVNGVYVLDAIRDRTFSITVTGNDAPVFTTPAGSIGSFYDSDEVNFQFAYSDTDTSDVVTIKLVSGELPGGLTLSPSGFLYGYIAPATVITQQPGYDLTAQDAEPYDFLAAGINKNYQFTLSISDGKSSDLRTFEMFVYDRETLTADTTLITADTLNVTADETPIRAPFLTNAFPTDLGTVRSDNYFAYQFKANDYDTTDLEFFISVNEGEGLPPGLALDPVTGWYYGYLPDQGTTAITYSFNIQVKERDNPSITSQLYPFTLTITGAIDAEVTWLTPSNLGTIENGSVSLLYVEAVNRGGRELLYRLKSGAYNELPQGLELLPTGEIVGTVSFNTFSVDLGTTTFDKTQSNVTKVDETTFDSTYRFTVNAYAEETSEPVYAVSSVTINNGGSGYTDPVITFSSPVGATASTAEATLTVDGGVITEVIITNPGSGYAIPATYTITDTTGGGAVLTVNMLETGTTESVSVDKEFTVTVYRAYNAPYQNIYIQAMPPARDRALIDELLSNTEIFIPEYVYRPDDPNFGKATRVTYEHAYGLAPDNLDTYVESLYLNHYWKNLVLGSIETAQALDANGNIIYEVVYSRIVDNLVNTAGESVSKIVALPYPIIDPADGSTQLDVVYPNSLVNMRDQVIDTVGQISTKLPLWMTSKQTNGRVLGFTPAWVICYTKPNRSRQIAYYIETLFAQQLNSVDFKVDRYILGTSLSRNWDTTTQNWTPTPSLTTFDRFSLSGYTNIGTVDIATELAYDQVNERPLSYITALGGLDGNVQQINGSTLIFVNQETYPGYSSIDAAWQDYLQPYDTGGYDATGELFDEAVTIPSTPTDERMAIYTISVNPVTSIVSLTKTTQTAEDDLVTVLRGTRYRNAQLYYPGSPGPNLTQISWLPVPIVVTTETIFDQGSMAFEEPVDMYDPTDRFDKYLVFPKANILV